MEATLVLAFTRATRMMLPESQNLKYTTDLFASLDAWLNPCNFREYGLTPVG